MFAWAFVDLGDDFSTKDANGETLKEVMVGDISQAEEAVVTTVTVPGKGDKVRTHLAFLAACCCCFRRRCYDRSHRRRHYDCYRHYGCYRCCHRHRHGCRHRYRSSTSVITWTTATW